MRADERMEWTTDDESLQAEFDAVSSAWQSSRQQVPRTPAHLERRIRQQARFAVDASTDIERHWILGHGPRLVLVTLILFAGVMLFWLA